MVQRISVCRCESKDTPWIPVAFAFTGFGVVSTSSSEWKQGTGMYSQRRCLAGATLTSSLESLVGTGAGSLKPVS